jgi:hypothetical protein
MNRELALQILRASCELEVQGDDFLIPAGCELTLHFGRSSSAWSIQQVQKVRVSSEGVMSGETRKGQRFAFLLEELRGALGDGSTGEKPARRTGFQSST